MTWHWKPAIEFITLQIILAMRADLNIWEYLTTNLRSGRQGGLMVSALDSEASGLGLSPGRGHYVEFLGKTQFTITVPLSTQVYKMSTGELLGKPNKVAGSDLLASRLGEVEILPAASCYRNRDKLRQLWANLGSKASNSPKVEVTSSGYLPSREAAR